MNRWLLWTALLAGAVATACDNGNKPDTSSGQQALVTFADCAELETYIKDTAVLEMKEWFEGRGYWGGPVFADDAAAEGAPSAGGDKSAPDHSETNSQVVGVDEADFVKTDGNRVFYLIGQRLLVLKSWPASETAIASTTQIEGYPLEMFLTDDGSLVVFSSVPAWTYDSRYTLPDPNQPWYSWYWYADGTKVTVFDVSTNTPALKTEYYLGGWYNSSRRIGSVVRLVASGHLRWPANIKRWLDHYDWQNPESDANKAAIAAVEAQNEALIRAQPLAEWLPKSVAVVNGQKVDVTPSCTSYHKPTVGAKLGLAMVATVNLATPGSLGLTTVMSEAGQVYASKDNLYIASPEWSWGWWRDGGQQDPKTWLHKFSLSSADGVGYLASGSVPGYINDQFSLDEYDGDLRIATHLTRYDKDWKVTVDENRLYVLTDAGNGLLAIVGATPPLAPGERIYSTRFFGTRGFMVTYKQIDPLFALDLSDPAQPKVMGELKIPGFSTYIHLLDPNHLLTIGNDTITDASTNWETRNGVSLQIFDVSDMTKPTLTSKVVVGTRYGYSQALWDHKAFNYFAKTGMLAIPFTDWNPTAQDYWGSFTSQLKVFHVDAAGGITPKGAVDHKDLYQGNNKNDWTWWYDPYIRRSVQIEDYVYSFSFAGVKVNESANPSVTVASLPIAPESQPTGGTTGTK